jgi:soluble lytic murein transglycosylase-like protein
VSALAAAALWLWSIPMAALDHHLDPRLVGAVVMVESSGNPAAVHARSRCVGLMQVNMRVWRGPLRLDQARMTEPAYNLRAGCEILRRYLVAEQGDVRRALRRYHGGRSWRYAERVLSVWEGRN